MSESKVPKWLDNLWDGFKDWSYRWVGALFMREKKDGKLAVSLDRVTFVGLLAYLCSFWNAWKPQKPDMEAIGEALLKVELPAGASPQAFAEMAGATVAEVLATLPPPDSLPPYLMEVFYVVAAAAFGTKALEPFLKKAPKA
jgi:hypothetical protein